MKFKVCAVFIGLLLMFGCQDRTAPTTADTANSNTPANDSNAAAPAGDNVPAPKDVKFESAGKVGIVGTFYESPKENSAAVLLLHQFRSNRQSFAGFARRLQAKGFGVLAIDGRGFGESVKTADGKAVTAERTAEGIEGMKADVSNAFDFLAKQKNVDKERIGIVGASYGSSLALMFAAEKPEVKAVALLSPGTNYFENMPTIPAVKKYGDRPLLLVAAEDDKESAGAVRELKEAGGNEKYEAKVYPQGGHGTNIFDAGVGLQDLLEKFLSESLKKQ